MVSVPGSGRFPGGGDGNPLENPMDRGPWWATVHGVTKSQTRLKRHSTLARTHPDVHLLRIIVPITSMGLAGRVEPPPLLQSSRTSTLAYNPEKVAPPWTEQGSHPLLLLLGGWSPRGRNDTALCPETLPRMASSGRGAGKLCGPSACRL